MGKQNSAPESDEDLLSRMRNQNDTEAFRLLYERYWEKLYQLCCRKLGDGHKSADLVQEIFVRLWEKRAVIQIGRSLDGYLFICLRNAVFNYYRNRLLQLKLFRSISSRTVTAENNIEAGWAYKELYGSLKKEVDQLPEKMRKVFLLSRKDNLTTKEISEKLSISEQTVRNQISVALFRIRKGIAAK